MPNFERILIGTRGVMARRLIQRLSAQGLETVAIFSEPDAGQPWVEEADYPVYLNGSRVVETYGDHQRVVSAALDAGCDVVHPGGGGLAESLDFHDIAVRSNLAILGADTALVKKTASRWDLYVRVRRLDIPTIPCTEDMPDGSDLTRIANTADALGYPCAVRAVRAPSGRRVGNRAELQAAVLAVRDEAERLGGGRDVYLEGLARGQRTLGTVVVADRHGEVVVLGHYADSVGQHGRWWIAEVGPGVLTEARAQDLRDDALRIATELDWVGVGVIRWVVSPSGGTYFAGVHASLPAAHTLLESLLGVDLVHTQYRIFNGERLAWQHSDTRLDKHGVMLRLMHLDPRDGQRPEGTIETFTVPEGDIEVGTAEGIAVSPETDPVLAEYQVLAPTRQAALVKAAKLLEQTVIEGVVTNRERLLAVLGHEGFWKGEYDIETVARLGWPPTA